MRRAMAAAILLLATGAAGAPAMPAWMAGCWEQASGDRWTEECWMPPRGGIMLGAGRSGQGDVLKEWESTQISASADGKLTYWGSPGGAARVPFAMVSQSPGEIVFANPAHDYPQRIRYWKDGEMLGAEISLADGTKSVRWSYRRVQ